MHPLLKQYIDYSRENGRDDEFIKGSLIAAGWNPGLVEAAVNAKPGDIAVPAPPPVLDAGPSGTPARGRIEASDTPQAPVAVVSQLTTRGLEYTIMFLALGVTAIALGTVLHDTIDTVTGMPGDLSEVASFAAAALIVALPIFSVLFLRLKKAELAEPAIRNDASRRRAVQLTLIISFLWGLGRLIFYIFSLINGSGGGEVWGSNADPIANALHTLVTVGIAGGIFAYYWHDEHRKEAT